MLLKLSANPAAGTPDEQRFSAAFELSGNPTEGSLKLLTPIGSTAAWIAWSPGSATLKAPEPAQTFNSLDALCVHWLGTTIPVPALFAWLAGQDQTVAGWTMQTDSLNPRKIVAHRHEPAPVAELTLILSP